jgi:hypothetical protein
MTGRRNVGLLIAPVVVGLVVVVGTITAALMALAGSDLSCGLGSGTAMAAAGPAPTKTALREIPKHFLTIYREAGSALDISWPFLASIGYQECGHGTGNCYVVNPSGCAGPMEIAYVRGSACSPDAAVPTIWERFKTDGDEDGKTSIFDPADAVFTAAKILRESDGAPPAGGSYSEYHEAACNYYGACGDTSADYADEVMARAVEYGFGSTEAEAPALAAEGEAAAAEDAGGEATHPEPEGTGTQPRGGRPTSETGGHEREQQAPPSSGSVCEASAVSSASGNEIVRIAESQLGTAEHPPGSNCQKYGPCESWCALFVAWVWERAGVPLEGGAAERAYSGSFYGWVREHGGRDLPPAATPKPGDAVMYGASLKEMDHVGIVVRVFPNGEITTIAGNFGDAVTESGPFAPAQAVSVGGQPAEIFAFAEPPTTTKTNQGKAKPPKSKGHRGGVAA